MIKQTVMTLWQRTVQVIKGRSDKTKPDRPLVVPSRLKLFWLQQKRRWLGEKYQSEIRSAALGLALLMVFSVGYDVFKSWNYSAGYELSARAESVLFPERAELANYIKVDQNSGAIIFNENYSPQSEQSGQTSQPKFQAVFHADPKAGIDVTDPVNQTTIGVRPLFRLGAPKQQNNRLVYPLLGRNAVKVVSLAAIGFKEDIILNKAQGDERQFEYELALPDGVEARLEADGSLGFYGVNTALLGEVGTGSEADAELLKKARQNGEKNQLLFRSPPPYVLEEGMKLSAAKAWFTLEGKRLTLHASGLERASYPLSIDPSIYVETAAKLMRGNNETNVDFDVNNELIQKGSTTGARIDDWAGTMSLNEGRWNAGTAVAGGYVYSVGGTKSNSVTSIYSTSGTDTYVVPTGVTSIVVKMWGAGGGGGGGSTNGDGGAGGGGGFVQTTLSVTPGETLDLFIGGPGGAGSFSSGGSGSNSGDGGGGGGHSIIERSSTPLAIAAGGGGGGGGDNSSATPGGAGGAGGGTTGSSGGASVSAPGGSGGTAGAGGGGGNGSGQDGAGGASEQGGNGGDGGASGCGTTGVNNGGSASGGDGGIGDDCGNGFGGGGGGGSGLFGGGGGSSSISGNAGGGGGGGGSSYVTGSSTTVTGGSGTVPGNDSDAQRAGAGEGGAGGIGTNSGSAGTAGRIVVTTTSQTDDTVSYVRSATASGTSVSLDIDSAGTNRLVVIMADDESTGTNLTGATVDGNACNLVVRADNGSGAGNHQEMWYCDEDELGASSETVTVAITGGDASWAVHAHLYTGVSQGGPGDFGIDNSSVGGSTVTVNGIDTPEDGLVIMGAGNGQSGTWNDGGWTSPLTERTDGANPTSAVFATASAIETTAQTNKTYTATASVADILRGTAIVASWDHGLVGSSGNEVRPEVYWARLSTTNSVIESPNPGAGACTDWCTSSAYSLPNERAGLSLVAYNGFLYAIGGVDDSGVRSDDIYIAKLGANGEPSLWHPTDTNKNNWVYWYQSSTYDLTSARSYLAAAAYNNRIYVLGGQTNASPGGVTTVEYAQLSPTGVFSSWTATGMSALPSVRHGHSVHVYNDNIYLIGGNSNGTLQNAVHYAKLNNDGTMNSWVATNSFNTARSSWGGNYTTLWGGYIYMGGGCTAVNGSGYCTAIADDVQLASINADGSLAQWGSMTNISNQRIGYGFVAWRNAVYRVGGCLVQDTSSGNCDTVTATTHYGVINPAGEVSTVSISVPSGTSPCSGGAPTNCDLPPPGDDAGEGGQLLSMSVILNGYLYNIGGCVDYDCNGTNPAGDDSDASGNISYVSISPNGELTPPSACGGTSYGTWCVDSTNKINNTGSNTTDGVAAAGVTAFNNRIYIVGGLTGNNGSNVIYYNDFNSDGSLNGAWESTTFAAAGISGEVAYTFAYARANPASAGTNPGNLYVFGGCGDIGTGVGCANSNYRTEVYKCNITTTGSVSGCTTTGQLQIDVELGDEGNDGLGIHSGTVYANYIYLIGGFSANVPDRDTVFYARFDNNNNVVDVDSGQVTGNDDDWIESPSSLSVGRRRGWAFGYNGHIYAVGGYDDSGTGIIPFIEWSKMNVSDGSIDSFITSSVTINQRWGLSMVVSNSYAYVIGGCDVGASPSSCSSFENSIQTFQLYNNDSGAVDNFTAQSDQTFAANTDRWGSSAAILNGYLYVAGGCVSATDCTDATNNVQYASISASDGTIGTWATASNVLPADRTWGALEVAGGNLYYLGGQDDTSTNEQSTVYYAGTFSSGNITAAWQTASGGIGDTASQAAQPRTKFGSAVWNNRIYVVGGLNGSAAVTNTVFISPQLNSGGNIAADSWTSDADTFNVSRTGAAVTAYANNLYLFGGFDGTNYLNDAQFTQINSDGTTDAWTYTTSLPGPLRDARAVSANGYIYLIGGRSAATTCAPNTIITPISANTTIASGNNPTGVGEWYETNVRYTGDRYGAAVAYDKGKLYTMGGGCTAPLSADRHYYSTVKSQPQVAKYSRMIDTDTDVFPNRWLMNGVDNSIGSRWQVRYRSSTAANAAWGLETNFGDVTLGTVNTYTPLDGSGINTNFARYFYFSVSIDASKTYGYPDDVTRGPTIDDITLFFTADPGKRLRHGKTFTGGEKQPLDTPPGP